MAHARHIYLKTVAFPPTLSVNLISVTVKNKTDLTFPTNKGSKKILTNVEDSEMG